MNIQKPRQAFILSFAVSLFMAFSATTALAVGKKYAITVGINNYPVEEERLAGAVNDATNMRKLLISRFGFLPANVKTLLDQNATRSAIIGQIKAYGALVGSGDLLVFHYSGHGSLFPDEYSETLDETTKISNEYLKDDGSCCIQVPGYYDSTLVPWDHDSAASGKPWKGEILDDELYDMFSAITAKGATVVFISDSCHSGTIGKAQKGFKMRFLTTEQALGVKHFSDLKLRKPANQKKRSSWQFYNRYVVLAAAKDDEYASDGGNPNVPGGLFTSTFIEIVNNSKTTLSYRRLMDLVMARINKFATDQSEEVSQHPQLDARFGNGEPNLFMPIPVK